LLFSCNIIAVKKYSNFGENNILKIVKMWFANYKIYHHARKVAGIVTSKTKYLELDVWVPDLRLGFEYQVRNNLFF
jgi:hypothetical protein